MPGNKDGVERPIVFLDIDGVMVDWVGGVGKIFDVSEARISEAFLGKEGTDPVSIFAQIWKCEYDVALDRIWGAVDRRGRRWWAELDLTPYATEILALAGTLAGPENLYFARVRAVTVRAQRGRSIGSPNISPTRSGDVNT